MMMGIMSLLLTCNLEAWSVRQEDSEWSTSRSTRYRANLVVLTIALALDCIESHYWLHMPWFRWDLPMMRVVKPTQTDISAAAAPLNESCMEDEVEDSTIT